MGMLVKLWWWFILGLIWLVDKIEMVLLFIWRMLKKIER
jgi:hypothetical protein